MSTEVGARIGAVLSADADAVRLIGYGTYQGREVPPAEVGGFNLGLPNPKLVMDDGTVAWGCECWWGPEERVRAMIGSREVVMVDMDKERRRDA